MTTTTEAARRLSAAWIDNSPVLVTDLVGAIIQLADRFDESEARIAALEKIAEAAGQEKEE